jgi:choline dehydrogenase-like flavoprotein
MTRKDGDITRTIDPKTAESRSYDAVIVGSGIAGSILALELSKKGKCVLVVEAGLGDDISQKGFQRFLETFYSAISKDNNAPYPTNPNAEMPRGPDIRPLRSGGQPNTEGYFVQNGPSVSDSVYTRVLGGTTMHWEGKTVRMLREDFEMQSRYGQGLDWPIGLDDLSPYYNRAEFEIGVSGDAESQRKLGVEFDTDYVYPMEQMPPSYLDQVVSKRLDGMKVALDGFKYELSLSTFPQGRNGIPNPKYNPWNGGKPFVPVGAVSVHQAEEGERCQGNTNCVPLCPIQAKYDARKTLIKALQKPGVDLLTQAVASRVRIDAASGRVVGIEVKAYERRDSPQHVSVTVRGKLFILAANAVENARLMLASGLAGSSGLVGRHLMDHPFLLAWGLLRKNAGVGRGPLVTSGICNLRSGSFRRNQAAFAVDVHNDGWGWATGSPVSNLMNTVDNLNKFGKSLRRELVRQISRQLLLATMVEMMPDHANRVTVDPAYTDALGNLRPVITYRIPEYSLNGIAYARQLSRMVFQRLGASEHTAYDPMDPGYIRFNGEGFAIRGGNHLSGTHIMGTDKSNSVVDSYQKSWDHENLYLVGAGSMPTIGTSNTTLTLAALCFRTAEDVLKRL